MPKDQFGRPAPSMNPRPAPMAGFALPNGSQFPGQGKANGLVKAPGVTPITPPPQDYAKPEAPYAGQPSMPFVPPSIDATKTEVPPSGGGYTTPGFAQQPIFGNLPAGARFNDAMNAKAMPQVPGGLFSQGK